MPKKVLYVSGSFGLGHVVRDLAIARALREQDPDVELSWLAPYPARMLIEEAGERVHPEADRFADDNVPAEKAAREGFKLNLQDYTMKAVGEWEKNVEAFEQVISRESFDLVVADEAYEIGVALGNGQLQMDARFVMIYDFFGNVAMTWNPMERLGTYMWNREWAKTRDQFDGETQMALFLGEPEDIPDTSLGIFLPNRRELAKQVCKFVGYVLSFDPCEYSDPSKVRARLGYGREPLIVCAIGGTAVGRDLLSLCGRAYLLVKERIPDLHMILVLGPRLAASHLDVPKGVEVRGYVPALYEHFAASDLAIVQSGGTATLELTALRRPFLYFPLEGHFEQQVYVARRLARHQAGVKMSYRKTTPESLAEKIIANLGREVTYAPIATDGAQKAAQLISRFM